MIAATRPWLTSRAGPRALLALGLGAGTAGVWALRSFNPNAADSPFMPCLFHLFTGLYCPGCGTTRALHALVHFDLAGALAMNAMLVLALPALALLIAQTRWPALRPLPLMRLVSNGYAWIALMVGFGIARNLPWWPLSWLAPG